MPGKDCDLRLWPMRFLKFERYESIIQSQRERYHPPLCGDVMPGIKTDGSRYTPVLWLARKQLGVEATSGDVLQENRWGLNTLYTFTRKLLIHATGQAQCISWKAFPDYVNMFLMPEALVLLIKNNMLPIFFFLRGRLVLLCIANEWETVWVSLWQEWAWIVTIDVHFVLQSISKLLICWPKPKSTSLL